MQGGREYQSTFSHDAPGLRAYGLMVTHGLNPGAGEVGGVVEIRWLPTVALSAAPSAVAEGGGATRVSVTARLTGSAVEDVAKTVAVRVGSGTATSGTDFKAVDGFTIPLPAGAREAVGAFELAPVADAEREGAETVAVTGSATQGGAALPVAAATVTIDDTVRRALTVAKPANGRITGPGIDCGGQGTDCAGTHLDGATVTLRAKADPGRLLLRWTGDCAGTGGCALLMDGDKSVGASFAAARTLTVAKPANGRITGPGIDCGGPGADCAGTHPHGASVTLRAAPDSGHLLRGWAGDCSGTGGCVLAMDADRAVGASFAAARTLTVARPADGRVAGTANGAAVIDCGTDCTETLVDGTVVALSAVAAEGRRFDAWGGACSAQASATCSVTLDADRSVSASFALGATAGRCDGSRVDGCSPGRLNRTAFGDSPTHHHWRCDGTNGGANSPRCSKAKEDCSEGGRGWTAGGLNCFGTVGAAPSGAVRPAEDEGDPTRGSASFLCDDGAWREQPGASCTVDLSCGGSRNSCLTDGVRTEGVFETAKEDGACAATQAQACTGGRPDRDSPPDVALENGACGTGQRQCAGGALQRLPPTEAAVRWRCLGTDAENRWSCLGTDGTGGWRCAYGGRSKSCSQPIDAISDFRCGEVTQEASDSPVCLWCRDGYEKHEGDCVRTHTLTVKVVPSGAGTVTTDDTLDGEFSCSTRCSENVEHGQDVTFGVVSKAGYSCPPLQPIPNMRSDRTVTLNCARVHTLTVQVVPSGAGTVTTDDTLDGELSCSTICSEDVEHGQDVTFGVVSKAGYSCPPLQSIPNMPSDRTVTLNCARVHTLTVQVVPSGKGTVTTDDTLDGEFSCSTECPDHVEHNKYVTLEKESNDGYECKLPQASFRMTSDKTVTLNCTRVHTLTVKVVPSGAGTVTTDDTLDGEFSCSTECPDHVEHNKYVTLEKESNDGYECKLSQASFRMTSDKTVTLNCTRVHTLTVEVVPSGKGTVTTDDTLDGEFSCSTRCSDDVAHGQVVTLEEKSNDGYECKLSEASFPMTSAKSVTLGCKLLLKADPGGNDEGEYEAQNLRITLPFGGWVDIYSVTVSASATGGVPPYKFQWAGQSIGIGAEVTYFLPGNQVFPVYKTVTVTDGAKPATTATATAKINEPGSSAATAGGGEDFAFEVPLGGELILIWGGGGTVAARSEDVGVAGVSVSSAAVRVTGAGLGATNVVVEAGGQAMVLPVVVR